MIPRVWHYNYMKILNYGDGYINTKLGKRVVDYYKSANYTCYDVSSVVSGVANTSNSGKLNVLVIDSFNIGYKFAHISSKQKQIKYWYDKESQVNIPMGIQSMFIDLAQRLRSISLHDDIKPDKLLVIVVFDPPHEDKANTDPHYKKGRKKKDRFNEAIKIGAISMSEIMPHCFIASAGYTEADDVVNELTRRISYGDLKDKVSKCTIMSADQDLHWNISSTTLMYKKSVIFPAILAHNYQELFGIVDSLKKFKVHPINLKFRKMLVGKQSDNWNKLKGYSERELVTFVNENKLTMENFMELCRINLPKLDFKELQTRYDVISTGLNIPEIMFYKLSKEQKLINPFTIGRIRSVDKEHVEEELEEE